MRRRKSAFFVLATAALPFVAVAVIAEVTAWYVIVRKEYNFYLPLELRADHIAAVRERFALTFDAVLGWEPPEAPQGADTVPPAGQPAAAIAMFGDSFTLGHPEPGKSWAAVLERGLGRRVLNFGVAGYGTDQALLRFERRFTGAAWAPYVTMGVFSENIARIVNRYRGFYFRKRYLNGVKPRFVLAADGTLRLLPPPIQSASELDRLLDPSFRNSIGADDYWYGKYAAARLNRTVHFPYSYFLARALPFYVRSFRDKRLNNDADYKPLYGDPATTALLRAILRRFGDEAAASGAVPIVVFFPGWKDLVDCAERRPVVYAAFRDELRAGGTTVLDALDYFAPHLANGGAVGSFFRSYADGHYNQFGEATVAAGVLADLRRLDAPRHVLFEP